MINCLTINQSTSYNAKNTYTPLNENTTTDNQQNINSFRNISTNSHKILDGSNIKGMHQSNQDQTQTFQECHKEQPQNYEDNIHENQNCQYNRIIFHRNMVLQNQNIQKDCNTSYFNNKQQTDYDQIFQSSSTDYNKLDSNTSEQTENTYGNHYINEYNNKLNEVQENDLRKQSKEYDQSTVMDGQNVIIDIVNNLDYSAITKMKKNNLNE